MSLPYDLWTFFVAFVGLGKARWLGWPPAEVAYSHSRRKGVCHHPAWTLPLSRAWPHQWTHCWTRDDQVGQTKIYRRYYLVWLILGLPRIHPLVLGNANIGSRLWLFILKCNISSQKYLFHVNASLCMKIFHNMARYIITQHIFSDILNAIQIMYFVIKTV